MKLAPSLLASDLADMAAKITDRTRAVVIINPNNPTGAVYPREIVEGILDLARRHHLIVDPDEVALRVDQRGGDQRRLEPWRVVLEDRLLAGAEHVDRDRHVHLERWP